MVIKGLAFTKWNHRRHLITSAIEHPSVIKTCDWLKKLGFRVTTLPVDENGRLHPEDLEKAINKETFLVTIMLANNETGSIQPISDLAAISHDHGIPFHTDAVQAVGKIPLDVDSLDVDFLTMSAHKLHGPKGIGAIYIRKGVALDPLIHGGGQESGMRAGTENTSGIVGFGKAAELAEKRLKEMNHRIRNLRDRLWEGISDMIPDAMMNGHPEERLPNTLNVSLPGMRGESVVLALDQKGISLSSGSACRSGSPRPSHALLAMGLTEEEAHCALRFSLGIKTTKTQIEATIGSLSQVIRESMHMVRFAPCR
jgi:cysteine sulfinate desulfinase/cysteine desulfurase-like protein